MTQEGFHHALPIGYQVHWYTIDQVLGQGGFGITYLAHDNNLDQRVAIKEYFPGEFVGRDANGLIHPISPEHADTYQWGLDRFITEARTLAKFDHPNIVRVMAVFEENQGAYMVMRYEEGDTLFDRFVANSILSETELRNILMPIIDGLSIVHEAGFIHRDIKPANIFIREDDSPVLIDFGSARQAIGEHTQTLTTVISPGYSPIEQYYTRGEDQGPWTDIYGLASTIYCGIAGERPVDTMTRSKHILAGNADPYTPAVEVGKGRYSTAFLSAIDRGMEFHHQQRPRDLATWKAQLNRESAREAATTVTQDAPTQTAPSAVEVTQSIQPVTEATEIIPPESISQAPSRKRRKKWPWIIAGVGLVFLIILIFQGREQKSPQMGEPDARSEKPEMADKDTRIDALLAQAERDIKADRLTIPRGNNAFERYRDVLRIDKDNQEARAGLEKIVKRKMGIIKRYVRQGKLDKAEEHVNHLLDLAPKNKKLKAIRRRIRDARSKQ